MAAKRFDSVTIIGVIIAVALLIGGQYWSFNQREIARKAQLAREEEQKKYDLEHPPKMQSGDTTQSPAPKGEQGDTREQPKDPKDPKAQADGPKAEPDKEDKIESAQTFINSDRYELVFTNRGATLEEAILAGVKVNTADPKSKVGLPILGEIERGKRSFGIPMFDIGTPDPDKEKDRLHFEKAEGAMRSLDNRHWTLEENSKDFDANGDWKLIYSIKLDGKYTVTKTFRIHKAAPYLHVDIGVRNESDAAATFSYVMTGPAGILLDGPPADPKLSAYVYIAAELAGRDPAQSKDPTVKQIYPSGETEANVSYPENIWGSIKNRFYMAMLVNLDPKQITKLKSLYIKHDPASPDKRLAEPNIGVQAVRQPSDKLEAGKGTQVDHYALYMGPSKEKDLAEAETALGVDQYDMPHAIHFCDIMQWQWPRVDWLARKLMVLFNGLAGIFGSYGIAVILLTLTLKLCLHPLQRRSMISMNKMQKLQPELKKLQEKYKNQDSTEAKQRLFAETQDLYKKAGANPISGCLPMFIQIPIFSALYGVFNRAYDIRGESFLWIKDLSQQDQFISDVGFWPHQINLLPLVYVAMTIIQQFWISPMPKSDDPQQDQMRKMTMFMPLMFSVMFYRMPAGLILYFAAQSVFSMLETWYVKKFLIKDEPLGPSTTTTKPPPAIVPSKA